MSIAHLIKLPNVAQHQINAVLQMVDEGATVPFMARYRKERTKGLDELQIIAVVNAKLKLDEVAKRQKSILKSIGDQDQLNDELKSKIENCWSLSDLEDLYLPFKSKRSTKAGLARENGLEPLAGAIMKQELNDPEAYAFRFVKGKVQSVEEALEGAQFIMAEWINERSYARKKLRDLFYKSAILSVKLKDQAKDKEVKYKDYYSYSSPISKTPGYRLLAVLRGEKLGALKVSITPDKDRALDVLERIFLKRNNDSTELVAKAIAYSYSRMLKPSIETETRNHFLNLAEKSAIEVFADNLSPLLMAAPLGKKRVMGIDPGFKSGCKVVCLSENGELLHNATIFPHPPQKKSKEASAKIAQLLESYKTECIAIGDGTAGRETMDFIKSVHKKYPVQSYLISEDGASVYSASSIARDEFPTYDVTVRGAVSIGRRLMDPLSELVKIDPKSIGVGQYQHDVDQKQLKYRLDQVVERCVNEVGVDLNMASPYLLQYVSGLSTALAKNIVEHRKTNGEFTSRKELLKVKGLGPKAFEQAAGFLRIADSTDPLDNSSVHPERYAMIRDLAKKAGIKRAQLVGTWMQDLDLKEHVNEDLGLLTLNDIALELAKPGRDPRGAAKPFAFAKEIKDISDVKVGQILPGKVSNITHFGAFVNIGIKNDGLLHLSQLANRYVSDPKEVVQLGQQLKVKVIEVDASRKRINLSLKDL